MSKDASSEMTTIKILFEGIMVFRKVADHHYEVGRLRTAPDHVFGIRIINSAGAGRDIPIDSHLLHPNFHWDILVRDQKTKAVRPADLNPETCEGFDRGRDSDACKEDFRWIIDMENAPLHDTIIDRYSNLLRPIVNLSHGRLHTDCKTHCLEFKQGINNSDFRRFGFVAEIIGLDIPVRPEEEVVLRIYDPTYPDDELVIFELRPGRDQRAEIKNTPVVHDHTSPQQQCNNPDSFRRRASHLQLYYLLLKVDPRERFEIRTSCPAEPSLNPYVETGSGPHGKSSKHGEMSLSAKVTVPPVMCGPVLLGKSTSSLD